MVHTQQEITVTQEEEPALLHSESTPSCFSTYGTVPLFCICAEPTSYKHCLPSSGAAPWPDLSFTLALLLAEPKAHGHFRPVRCQHCGQGWVETPDTFLTLFHHFLFGGCEGVLQL